MCKLLLKTVSKKFLLVLSILAFESDNSIRFLYQHFLAGITEEWWFHTVRWKNQWLLYWCRRVLTNLFGSRKVLAYVTTPEKDSCTRRLFFSTIFPEQLQIFCAWQEKASLNQTGSGWFQYIPLFLFMQMEYRNMLLWAENILVFMQLHDAQPQRNRNADNEAFALRRWQICRLQE